MVLEKAKIQMLIEGLHTTSLFPTQPQNQAKDSQTRCQSPLLVHLD